MKSKLVLTKGKGMTKYEFMKHIGLSDEEIESYEHEPFFWKYAVPTFMVLVMIGVVYELIKLIIN